MLDGRVDAVLARPPLPDAPVRRVCLLSEPRVLVMAADHPLAGLAELRVADLAGVLQVDTDGVDEAWGSFWTRDPRPDGSRPRYGPLVHSVEEMLEVCAGTSAVGITAASVVDLYARPDLAFRPIIDVTPSTVELVWVEGARGRLLATLLESVAALADADRGIASQGIQPRDLDHSVSNW